MTGIVAVIKPGGVTSFDVVARIRRLLGEKKVGHSGTLDPMATGVMLIMLGRATKFLPYLPSGDKEYEAQVRLGVVTDTLDITGKVIEERRFSVTPAEFESAAKSFLGKIKQMPPMYSAVSVDGQRLYKLARKGIEVERPLREVEIKSIACSPVNPEKGEYTLSVECSAGTYIRTLIGDIGEKLGCGAVMTALCRTAANGFDISRAVSLEGEDAEIIRNIENALVTVESVFDFCPSVSVSQAQAVRFSNGGELSAERINQCPGSGLARVYAPDGRFLGLGKREGESLKAEKLFL